MNRVGFIALLCVGAMGTMLPQAKASEADQKILFTFSGPVEIPGQVLLAGTYTFKIADNGNDRDVVEVLNKDETHAYGFFLAIPDMQLTATGKPIITFAERAAGSPEAVRAWFYPGDNYGHEFVYPKTKAAALAKANHQTVASMPDQLAGNTTKPAKTMKEAHIMAMKNAQLKAQKSTGEEVGVSEAFPKETNNTAGK